tara:strand:+ start:187 stop:471 length:285 start_codon:yes stop_codon:yes gene_type:complete
MNLLPGIVMGIDFKSFGNLLREKVGTTIFKCEIIFVFIFKDFFVDLSIIEANPKSLAFDFFINFTHSKLDLPVVITSSIIKTFEPFLILNPFSK